MWLQMLTIPILQVYTAAFEMARETCVLAGELSISKISRKKKKQKSFSAYNHYPATLHFISVS